MGFKKLIQPRIISVMITFIGFLFIPLFRLSQLTSEGISNHTYSLFSIISERISLGTRQSYFDGSGLIILITVIILYFLISISYNLIFPKKE